MLYPSLTQLLDQVNSRYLLVNIIARRARDIAQDEDDMGYAQNDKPVSCAINEIATGELRVVLSQID